MINNRRHKLRIDDWEALKVGTSLTRFDWDMK